LKRRKEGRLDIGEHFVIRLFRRGISGAYRHMPVRCHMLVAPFRVRFLAGVGVPLPFIDAVVHRLPKDRLGHGDRIRGSIRSLVMDRASQTLLAAAPSCAKRPSWAARWISSLDNISPDTATATRRGPSTTKKCCIALSRWSVVKSQVLI
jgi:hypothetical protein